MVKCEGCEEEKEVTDIEGNLLCKECTEDIVRCDFCNRLLATSHDDLEADNFGTLSVPELTLPDKRTHLIFCNIDCLEGYLQKYKKELRYECGIKIECESKDDGDLIFKEIINAIKRLGNEGKLKGAIKYGYL